MRKRVAMALAGVLVAGVVAGCGGGSQPAQQPQPGAAPAPAQAPAREVTVSIWSWRSQDKPLWAEVEKRLQARGEKIKIEFRDVKATEYDAALKTAMNAGEGPDIITSRAAHGVKQYASAQQYEVLEGKVAGLKDFSPGALAQVSYEGKVYAVPFAVQTAQFFYNSELFAKNGWKEPETWAELIQLLEAIKAKGITPLFIPGREGWALNLYIDQIGATYLTDEWVEKLEKGEVTYKDAKFIDVLKRFDTLKKYAQKDFMASSTDDERTAFATGQAAMVLDGIWSVRAYLEINKDLKTGSFMVPGDTKDAKRRIYAFLDGGYAMNAASKNKDAALKVLNFAATKEFGQLYTDTFGEISAYPGIAAPPGKDELKKAMERYQASSVKKLFRIRSVFDMGTPSVSTVMGPELQAMLDGKKTPEQVAAKLVTDLGTWYPPFKGK